MLLGRLEAFDPFLERLDHVPRLEASSHNTKIEFLHEDKFLIHLQKNVPGYLLLLKDIAVLRLHPQVPELTGGLHMIPTSNLFLHGSCLLLLFFIRFVPMDI
jgi:hypothetical protein